MAILISYRKRVVGLWLVAAYESDAHALTVARELGERRCGALQFSAVATNRRFVLLHLGSEASPAVDERLARRRRDHGA